MNAPTLFDVAPAGAVRRNDYETSIDAAVRVGEARMLYQSRIMAELRKGPLTDRELCLIIEPARPVKWQSVISARSGLKKKHRVEPTVERRDGRIVWRVRCEIEDVRIAGSVL